MCTPKQRKLKKKNFKQTDPNDKVNKYKRISRTKNFHNIASPVHLHASIEVKGRGGIRNSTVGIKKTVKFEN